MKVLNYHEIKRCSVLARRSFTTEFKRKAASFVVDQSYTYRSKKTLPMLDHTTNEREPR